MRNLKLLSPDSSGMIPASVSNCPVSKTADETFTFLCGFNTQHHCSTLFVKRQLVKVQLWSGTLLRVDQQSLQVRVKAPT